MKKKLSLSQLKVKSFITSVDPKNAADIQGGRKHRTNSLPTRHTRCDC